MVLLCDISVTRRCCIGFTILSATVASERWTLL